MEIAIDITPLYNRHKMRGTGAYTRLLIEALQKYENQNTYTFFTRGQNVSKTAALVHYPYFDPFFLTLPWLKPKPTVVTVHDLIPLVYPAQFPPGLRGKFKWQIQRWSLTGATMIIADSLASAKDIKNLVKVSQTKLRVIYLAPGKIFKKITQSEALNKIHKKYNLPTGYILYVGDLNWNKNIEGLVRAIAVLRAKLVLVGKTFLDLQTHETRQLNYLIRSLNLEDRVLRVGFVPEEDLVGMYNLASVYVQPSFIEGFGLPVLEAMACGCPTVVANIASLAEIAGPSLLINPYDFKELARAINKILNYSSSERNDFLRKCLAWSAKFSWKKTAKATAEVYEKVITGF